MSIKETRHQQQLIRFLNSTSLGYALEFLNADTNLLANLSSTTLSGFANLTELHVSNNHLLYITSSALDHLFKLQSLYLDGNEPDVSVCGSIFQPV